MYTQSTSPCPVLPPVAQRYFGKLIYLHWSSHAWHPSWLSHTQSDLTKVIYPLIHINVGVLWVADMQPWYPPCRIHWFLFVSSFDSFMAILVPPVFSSTSEGRLFCTCAHKSFSAWTKSSAFSFFYLIYSLKERPCLVLPIVLPHCIHKTSIRKEKLTEIFKFHKSREKSIINTHVFINFASIFCHFCSLISI